VTLIPTSIVWVVPVVSEPRVSPSHLWAARVIWRCWRLLRRDLRWRFRKCPTPTKSLTYWQPSQRIPRRRHWCQHLHGKLDYFLGAGFESKMYSLLFCGLSLFSIIGRLVAPCFKSISVSAIWTSACQRRWLEEQMCGKLFIAKPNGEENECKDWWLHGCKRADQ